MSELGSRHKTRPIHSLQRCCLSHLKFLVSFVCTMCWFHYYSLLFSNEGTYETRRETALIPTLLLIASNQLSHLIPIYFNPKIKEPGHEYTQAATTSKIVNFNYLQLCKLFFLLKYVPVSDL